jgi:hypothetical protein
MSVAKTELDAFLPGNWLDTELSKRLIDDIIVVYPEAFSDCVDIGIIDHLAQLCRCDFPDRASAVHS